ncbi:MAG TPA: META domain-containing protein [Trueperaceae bacterium]|nr:META domain-containing protein [Trueperaceae bacterium]
MSPSRKVPFQSLKTTAVALTALLASPAWAQSEPMALPDLFGKETWSLVSVTFEGVEAPVRAGQDTAFSVNVDGSLAGSVGCNQIVATAELEPGGAVSFGPVTSTLMACPDPAMSLERTFVAALEAVESYVREGGTVTLTGADAEVVFTQVTPGPAGEEEGAATGVDEAALQSFNAAIAAAGNAGAPWVHDPLRVALAFVELHGARSTVIEQELPEPEGSAEATVSVEEHGLLDDSIEGVRQVVTLQRSDDGWRVVDVLVTWFCRRGPEAEVVAPARCA